MGKQVGQRNEPVGCQYSVSCRIFGVEILKAFSIGTFVFVGPQKVEIWNKKKKIGFNINFFQEINYNR